MAYFRLLRLPTVFTAMADIVLGFLLTHLTLEPVARFAWLLVASSCLYLAGMVFNDVFDRRVDAVERPNRPIPSGQISLCAAVLFGALLIVGGLVAAALAGGQALKLAGLLTVCILAYDGYLKRTPLGPLAMGSCRFLNVMLGASDQNYWPFLWARPQILAAAGLGIYIIGVTWFARTEARESSRRSLMFALLTANLGIGVLVAVVLLGHPPGETNRAVVLAMLAFTTFIIDRRAAEAIYRPVPRRVQVTIKTMLLSLIVLDATLVFFQTNNPTYAMATVSLVIPAVFLSRAIAMT